eukprot:Pgem_evm1s16428
METTRKVCVNCFDDVTMNVIHIWPINERKEIRVRWRIVAEVKSYKLYIDAISIVRINQDGLVNYHK